MRNIFRKFKQKYIKNQPILRHEKTKRSNFEKKNNNNNFSSYQKSGGIPLSTE
jgi:hypothetical protein